MPEIMVPLIGILYELKQQKEIIQKVAKEVFAEYGIEVEFEIGTMIEIPRAALTADRIATEAQYFDTLRALPFLASGSCKCKHLLPLHKNSPSVPRT